MHGLADVQHGVEDDRVSGVLHLVSAGGQTGNATFACSRHFCVKKRNKSHHSINLSLDEDLHDGSADLHPHAILLEHVEKRQETLLGNKRHVGTEGHSLLSISGLQCFIVVAHHGEEDREVVKVGEDLPYHRLQLDAENKIS